MSVGEMAGPILPSESNAFSVGSSNNRFLDAYFSRAVDISGVAISPDATGSGIKVTSAATGALADVQADYIQASNIKSIGDVQAENLIADYVLGSNIRSVGDVKAENLIADYVLGSNIRSVGDVQANFVLGSNIRSVGDVQAQNITASGLLTASNIRVLGDYVILDTITSNTEQMVITNDGTGPALKVTQTGANSIAEFYDDGNALAFKVANDGLIGIGTATPQAKLHVVGSALVSSNLNVTGNLVPTAVNLVGTGDTLTAATHYFVETGSDGFVRPKTLANAKAELVTTASVNSAAATTVGTITSGIWNAGAVTSSGNVSAGAQVLAPSGGLVGAPGFSWTGNTNTGIYRPATNELGIVTNGGERVRVLAGGNVGIGTTYPTRTLHVNGTTIISNETAGYDLPSLMILRNLGNSDFLNSQHGYQLELGKKSDNKALAVGVMDSGLCVLQGKERTVGYLNLALNPIGGNVGIGTTNPQTTLDVGGTTSMKLPVGNSSERPANPSMGFLRFNIDFKAIEFYNGLSWKVIQAPDQIVFDGLVAYLDAGNVVSYSGSGTTWKDMSTSSADGTLVNGVTFNSENGGNLLFNGTNHYVSSTLLQNYVDFTIVFKPDFGQNFSYLLATGVSTDRSVRFLSNTTSYTISNPGNDGDWAYPSATTYFINGIVSNTINAGWNIMGGYRTNTNTFASTFPYYLGSGYGTRFFKGNIAVVLLYKRQLSSSEQFQNFTTLRSRFNL